MSPVSLSYQLILFITRPINRSHDVIDQLMTVITFLDDYFSYCRVAFLCKKTDVTEAIKAVSSCGQISLSTLLNACILIMEESI